MKYFSKLIFLITFICTFIYVYKNSKKFRKSVIIALILVGTWFGAPSESTSKGVEGFTIPEQTRSSRRKGFFSNKSNNNGSGPG